MTEIPKCPACGRRPSERRGDSECSRLTGDRFEPDCPDPCHDAADLGPAAVALLRETRAKIRVHLNGYCFGDPLLHQIDALLAAAPDCSRGRVRCVRMEGAMTAPKPPEGFDSWLDWCVQNAEYRDLWIERNCPMGGEQPHYMEEAAQAELAALRARVADLEQQVAALADALADELKLARGWAKNSIKIHAASEAALRAAGRKT